MRKYITLIVTCSLLVTMVPFSTVQAMLPTGHHEAGKPKDEGKSESSGSKRNRNPSLEEGASKRIRVEERIDERFLKEGRGREAREQAGRGRVSYQDSYGVDQTKPKDQYGQNPDDRVQDVFRSDKWQDVQELLGKEGYGDDYDAYGDLFKSNEWRDVQEFLRKEGYDGNQSNSNHALRVHIRSEAAARNYFTAQVSPVTDEAWGWMVKFVTLSALLRKDFPPSSINNSIQDSETGSLVSKLTGDPSLTKQYSSEELRKYAMEFDAMLRERASIIATLYPKGHYSSDQAIAALSHAAIVAAVAIYDHTQVDGFSIEKLKKSLNQQ